MSLKSDESFVRASKKSVEEKKRYSWLSYIFTLIAAFASATGSLFLKITDENKTKVVLISSMLQYVFLYPMLTWKKIEILTTDRKTNALLLVRGLLYPATFTFLGFSMDYLSLGDSMAIFYTYPALVGFLACICLKEKCGILNVVLTVVTMIGFVLVAQPSFIFGGLRDHESHHYSWERVLGSMFALAASLGAALATIVVRKLGPGVHFTLSMFFASWEGVLFVLVYTVIARQTWLPCWNSVPYILGCTFANFVSQAFRTLALQMEKAATVTLVQTSQVIFSYLLQFIFLHEVPSLLGGIGGGLILCSCVALAMKSIIKLSKQTK